MNLKLLAYDKEMGIVLVLVLLVVAFSVLTPHFLTVSNLFNIAKQVATLGIIAVGFTFVLITAGIDLAVGYQVSLSVVVCGFLMVNLHVAWLLAILLTLLLGTAVGLANGLIIAHTGVAPLIITLSMMMVLNGVSYLISEGLPIIGFPKDFSALSAGVVPGRAVGGCGHRPGAWSLLRTAPARCDRPRHPRRGGRPARWS